MSSVPTLGYWDCRGLGEQIRYLLNYVGVQFNDKQYAELDPNSWFKEKYNLGLDFPNVPYYIEGDLKLTQSLTIMRYLARKHGLVAKDEKTLALQELVEQQIKDMDMGLVFLYYDDDYEKKRPNHIKERLIPQLEELVKFLGSKDWLTTDFSYIDIMAYEVIDKIRAFTPENFENYPTLGQYLTRFENLKPIKEYQSSPKFMNWPFAGPQAHWGYNK